MSGRNYSTVQVDFMQNNNEYSNQFRHGGLALPPAKGYVIVTCMDARIDPAAAFGIKPGDAHVIRNAGGMVRDSLRSIIISNQLLATKEIMVVKHTGCGMLTFRNEDAHAVVANNLGARAASEIRDMDFMAFPNLQAAVRDDCAFLRKTATVPDDIRVSGWVYEVETGKVGQVC